jgi:hypothetical protein
MQILLDFNAKVGRKDIFKQKIWNESLHQGNDSGVTILKYATSKHLVVMKTMYTCNSPDGQTHNQTDNILLDSRWNSSILDVRSFR